MRKIVVRFPNWVGDAAMATSFIAALRNQDPEAEIHVLIRSHLAPLIRGLEHVHAIILTDKHKEHSIAGIVNLRRTLKRIRADIAYCLPTSFSSALILFVAGIPQRVGFSTDGRGWLLTKRIPANRNRHLVEEYAGFLGANGHGTPPTIPPPRIVVLEEHLEKASEAMVTSGMGSIEPPFVIINPSANYGPSKKWHGDRFAEVIRYLKEAGAGSILLSGGPREGEDLRALAASCAKQVDGVFVGSKEDGIGPLVGLLSHADLLISNDTGAAHVAAALGRPVLSLFGASSPLWTRPLGDKSETIYHPAPCSPCFQKRCTLERHECMENIQVDEVAHKAAEMLGLK